MSGISGPAVYSCPWCGRSVEQGESCWCKQSQEEAMTRQEIRAALKGARADNVRLTAERDRLQAELEKERGAGEKAEMCSVCHDTGKVDDSQAWDVGQEPSDCPYCPSVVDALRAERDRLQAQVRELENSFFCPHCNAKFPTTADGAIEALEHEQTCKQSPIVQERDALRAENARLWEALVFARDFIMSGPRPGDEMMAVQRISAALKPEGGES